MERYRHTGEEPSRQFVNKADKSVLTASEQEKEHVMNENKAHLPLPDERVVVKKTDRLSDSELPTEKVIGSKRAEQRKERVSASLAISNDPDKVVPIKKHYKLSPPPTEEPISSRKEPEGPQFDSNNIIIHLRIDKESPERPATELPNRSRSLVGEPGTGDPPPPDGGKQMDRSPRWKPFITSYPIEGLRALKFQAEEEISRAVDKCYEDPALINMPLDFADGTTMIVPQEAVALLRSRGFEFEDSTLLSPEDLTPEEVTEMQQHSI